MEEFDQRLVQAEGSGSDLIALLNAYLMWREALRDGLKGGREKQWCQQQCLELKNLRELHETVEDLKRRLQFFRLECSDDTFNFREGEKIFAVKICIAGAFYPNYFEFGGSPPTRDDYKSLSNMNPSSCVYLKRMPANRLSQIYERQVRENLFSSGVADDIDEMQVKFDTNSTRLVVEFKSITHEESVLMPGEVRPEIYRAVKLRKIQKNMELNMMSEANERKYAVEMKLGAFKDQRFVWRKKILKASKLCIYPKTNQVEMTGSITNVG
jgi:ATP-dependent RNA helicase TDRD9